jgi:hypothetical protein
MVFTALPLIIRAIFDKDVDYKFNIENYHNTIQDPKILHTKMQKKSHYIY